MYTTIKPVYITTITIYRGSAVNTLPTAQVLINGKYYNTYSIIQGNTVITLNHFYDTGTIFTLTHSGGSYPNISVTTNVLEIILD